jgi:hypothetical protein
MNRIVLLVVVSLALLGAGLAYVGLPKVVFAAVVVGAWLLLTVVLSFVGDRRYLAAYGGPGQSSSPAKLSIGRAILIGELVVNVPVIGLLVGITAAIGSLLEHITGRPDASAITITSFAIAFIVAWAWWSFATPRWLIWAMKRVADPLALKNAAVGSILWPDQGLGRFFNGTQWRSAAMEEEELNLIQQGRRRVQFEARRRRSEKGPTPPAA